MQFLLMVLLALVCLFESYPAPPWGGTPALSAGLTALTVALVGLHAFFVSRRLTRPLARNPAQRDRVLPRYERGRFIHQFVVVGAYVLVLVLFGWGWAVRQSWQSHGRFLPGLEVLTLAPFVLEQVLSWLCFYDADRAAHRAVQQATRPKAEPAPDLPMVSPPEAAVVEPALAETPAGEPAARPKVAVLDRPASAATPGRWAYVLFQLRQKMALIFIPVALLIAQKELLRLLPTEVQEWQFAANALGLVGLLGLFLGMPWIVRLILGLKPLPSGVLRDRLIATARRVHFQCSDILLWNTRRNMANAMVVGILPWVRYVVFTDRLIEEFTEEEVEAVFGHEMGHIKHHHMPYYFAFLTASMAALGLVGDYYLVPLVANASESIAAQFPSLISAATLQGLASVRNDLAIFPVVLALLSYIFVVFGFLSRRCERQADIYGCRVVSCSGPTCSAHSEEQRLPAGARGLCPTGIRTFIQALEKVADINGISRDRPGFLQSWQHSTIAKRVAFLQRMLDDPSVERAFQRRVGLIKWALFLGLGGLLAVLLSVHGWQL